MTILALTLLTAAALLGGLAVDVMRFENERTRIQTALDLCVLNAANMRQTLSEQTVFDDCVATADVKGAITKLTVTKSTTTKTVSATATKFDLKNPQAADFVLLCRDFCRRCLQGFL